MRRIDVELAEPADLTLVEFLRAGMSFGVCRAQHCWPPLSILNAFLGCGCDVLEDGRVLRWTPFVLSDSEYRSAIADVDPGYRVDGLGVAGGVWQRWFALAVALPRPRW